MNKQEAIEQVKNKALHHCGEKECYKDGCEKSIELNTALEIINQIDEPQKPRVPQVAVEFYERYKDDNLDLGEWFGDFYSSEVIEEFPRMDELTEWLHGNDNETNRQREFVLATLVTFGTDAVEVEKEKLYWLRNVNGNSLLAKNYKKIVESLGVSTDDQKRSKKKYTFTEREIKDFDERYWAFALPVETEDND